MHVILFLGNRFLLLVLDTEIFVIAKVKINTCPPVSDRMGKKKKGLKLRFLGY